MDCPSGDHLVAGASLESHEGLQRSVVVYPEAISACPVLVLIHPGVWRFLKVGGEM